MTDKLVDTNSFSIERFDKMEWWGTSVEFQTDYRSPRLPKREAVEILSAKGTIKKFSPDTFNLELADKGRYYFSWSNISSSRLMNLLRSDDFACPGEVLKNRGQKLETPLPQPNRLGK